MQIYIPQPVVVDGTLHFQARIPHDGHWILITKPSNAPLTLRYGDADDASIVVPHDKYYYDPDDNIHHAVYTLPNQQRISIIWIPRPMTYHHIHIQTPRLLVQITTQPHTHTKPI
jgi:hypothetical protein